MRLVRLDRHQKRSHPESRRPKLFDDGVHLFDGLPRLVVHFLDGGDTFAQIDHVENGGMAWRQFADDQIDQLQGGKPVQLLARKKTAEC